jgi:hypothetical protein
MVAKLSRMVSLALVGAGALSLAALTAATSARADEKPLGHYNATTKDFWLHPPDDWWRGDETEGG